MATGTDRFQDGITFFNAGQYYDAHEAWEDVWRSASGAYRGFCQGLIQAAVGLHHLSRGNTAGGRSQISKSIRNLRAHAAAGQSVDVAGLLDQLTVIGDRLPASSVRIVQLK